MKTLTLKAPALLIAQLNSYASKKGLSKSEIVRLALAQYLSRTDAGFDGSFLELAEDLAGSIDAPADISTSKDHLEGYGV